MLAKIAFIAILLPNVLAKVEYNSEAALNLLKSTYQRQPSELNVAISGMNIRVNEPFSFL